MKIKKLIEKIKKKKEIKKTLNKEGFLVSALSILGPDEEIKEWDIGFYDPKKEEITEVHTAKDSIEISEPDKPVRKITKKPDISKMKISPEKALKKAKEKFEEYDQKAKKIILSFQKKEKEIWNITFIGEMGSIVNIEIDSKNGEIINSSKKFLFKKGSGIAG